MIAACPPDGELDRLLGDQLNEAEESVLETHVSGCVACQARLDRMTRGLLTLPHGADLSGHDQNGNSAAVIEQVAELAPVQVRLIEQRHASTHAKPATSPVVPTAEARFTVLSHHAQGGLGRIHKARDEQLHRTVALKEIRPERVDDPGVRQRFLAEAEITGQLEHPGIVPIYALEHDAAGRPVYAMRFVQGHTLTDAIREYHRRPTALRLHELLQRFISVCQTVAYAHSQGVIHRDLKPDNVMLGDYGETLVVDWGLAKRLCDRDDSFALGPAEQQPASAATSADQLAGTLLAPAPFGGMAGLDHLTAAGQVMGTPAYMAPEQARGEPLSPMADVYSLGAVLFTILTGRTPHQGTSAIEILHKVAAGELPAVTGAPRALNAIYFKAMARDLGSRYATAADLARDVERWLADEPVSAYREPWPARAGRWARRHRTLVAALSVGAVLIAATSAGVGWWQSRLADERRAEQARAGEQIQALLDRGDAAIAADDAAGAQLAAGDAEVRADDPGADRLKERITRTRALADLLADLDRIDDLRWNPENGIVEGTRRLARELPSAFARLGVNVGRTPAAEAASILNGSPIRERLLAALDLWLLGAPTQERAALAEILAAADPDAFRDAARAAIAQSDQNAVKALAGRDEAMRQPAWFAAALGSIDELPQARRLAVLGTAARTKPQAFALLMTAGNIYRINDPRTAADRLGWFRAAVAVRPASCVARTNLGVALRDRGDLEGAIAELRTAITLDPSYAMAHNNLGVALSANRDRNGAIAEYRTAISLDPKSYFAHNNLGNALTLTGDLDGAIAEFNAAIAINSKVAAAHNNLGYALKSKGSLDDGMREYRTAIALDPKHALAKYNLGNALLDKNDPDAAMAQFRAATAIESKYLQAMRSLADAQKLKGDLKRAIAFYKDAIKFVPKDAGLNQRLVEAERWQAMLPRLNDVAAGKVKPANAAEAAEFSLLCRQPFQRRYAASARLYEKACAADPKYARDAAHFGRRYDAARSAAQAGCGQGADAPSEATARAALRGQALGWLETNLKILARRLASGTTGDRKYVAEQLSALLTEKQLADIRPGAIRDGWSPTEAAAWDAYWAEVRDMLARSNDGPR